MVIQDILEILIDRSVYMAKFIPIVFLFIASYTDIKSRKIKNFTSYPMFILGLILSEKPLVSLGLGILLGVIMVLIPGFSAGMGDVKLMAACGAWLSSLNEAMIFLLLSIGLVTLFNIALLIKKEGFLRFIKQLKMELFLTLSRIVPKEKINSLPLAPFVLVSFVYMMFLYKGV